MTLATVANETSEVDSLNHKQVSAINCLIENKTWKETCKEVGCAESTLKRWHTIPAFRNVLTASRREAFEASIFNLKSAFGLSIETHCALMRSAESESVKCQAAKYVQDAALKVFELGFVRDRVELLESTVAELANRA